MVEHTLYSLYTPATIVVCILVFLVRLNSDTKFFIVLLTQLFYPGGEKNIIFVSNNCLALSIVFIFINKDR